MTDDEPFDNLSHVFAVAGKCVHPDGKLDVDKFLELSGANPGSDYTRKLVENFAEALDIMSKATRAMQVRIKLEREFNGKDPAEL